MKPATNPRGIVCPVTNPFQAGSAWRFPATRIRGTVGSKCFHNPQRQGMARPTYGPVDAIVYVVLLVEFESQAGAGCRQQSIRTEVAPGSRHATNAAKSHEAKS